MTKVRNYCIGLSIALSGFSFAQGVSSSNYQNQQSQFIAHIPSANSSSENSLGNTLNSGGSVTKVASKAEILNSNLEELINDPVLRHANWGFMIYDPKTNEVVSSYNEKVPLIPASTTKLLTTETALSLLGGNYRWTTQVEYSGNLDENGVLNGNLYLVGSGDPSLGTNKAGASSYSVLMSDIVYAMKEKGIKRVNGNVVLETAVFKDNALTSLPENIVWQEQRNYFLPVGGTNTVDPKEEKLIIKSSSPTDAQRYFYMSPYTHNLVYTDKYQNGTLSTKLPEVPAYLVKNLRLYMVKNGIGISGSTVTESTVANPDSARYLVYSYKSPTLAEIIYYTNQHSDNALAEATLRMVGFQKNGDQTLSSGIDAVRDHLGKSKFDLEGFNYVDGSGLSRSHAVTPYSQVKFLSSVMDKPYFKDYLGSLPIGGQTGTLKKMFLGTGYGSVYAKTGTLNKVKTLAGYLKTASGKTLVFSVLVNNFNGSVPQVKSKIEKVLEPVLDLY